MNTVAVEAYWQEFLSTLPEDSSYHSKSYIAEGWGDGPEMVDELGTLIVDGIKTATCSSLWEWEAEGETPPETGAVTIVLDGRGEPMGIVETTEVSIRSTVKSTPILLATRAKATCPWDTGGKRTRTFSRAP